MPSRVLSFAANRTCKQNVLIKRYVFTFFLKCYMSNTMSYYVKVLGSTSTWREHHFKHLFSCFFQLFSYLICVFLEIQLCNKTINTSCTVFIVSKVDVVVVVVVFVGKCYQLP